MTTKKTSKNKPITLNDVARHADVSAMTVSKVIRNTGRISTKTYERVHEAIAHLGYVPNRLAGSLKQEQSSLVGVIIPSVHNIIFAELLSGINQVLHARGLNTMITTSEFNGDVERELVLTLLSWKPSGLILTGGITRSTSLTKILAAQKCPIIQLWDNDEPGFDVSIGFSHLEAGKMMAEHFLERGYKNIAYVGTERYRDISASHRLKGFQDRLAKAGLKIKTVIFEEDVQQPRTGREATRQLMEKYPETDAIFYHNDTIASGGIAYLYHNGYQIPSQVAVAGFNGISLLNSIEFKMTTIDVERFNVGILAGESLIELMDGKEPPPVVDVEMKLVVGNTT